MERAIFTCVLWCLFLVLLVLVYSLLYFMVKHLNKNCVVVCSHGACAGTAWVAPLNNSQPPGGSMPDPDMHSYPLGNQ